MTKPFSFVSSAQESGLHPPATLRGNDISSIDVTAIIDNELDFMLSGYDLNVSTKKAVPHREAFDSKTGLPIFTNTVPLKDALFSELADTIYAYAGSRIGTPQEKAKSQKIFTAQCDKILAVFADAETSSHTGKWVINTIKMAADRHVTAIGGRNI